MPTSKMPVPSPTRKRPAIARGRLCATETARPTPTRPALWTTAAPRRGRAAPSRCTMKPETGSPITDPSDAASSVSPSSPADSESSCLRSGTREAKAAKAAPLMAKAVNTAARAVRTAVSGGVVTAVSMGEASRAGPASRSVRQEEISVESIRPNRFDSMPSMASRGQARPTLRTVAERAGVSVSTASLVFSGKGPVAPATADRVKEAAAELGFAGPNPLASSLRQGRAGAIAVLDGLAEELEAIPTGMLLLGQPSGVPESTVPRLAGLGLDAVVFSLCGPGDHPAVEYLSARGIPMFSTGVPADRRITQVRVDERGAAAEIARYV